MAALKPARPPPTTTTRAPGSCCLSLASLAMSVSLPRRRRRTMRGPSLHNPRAAHAGHGCEGGVGVYLTTSW
jgi:hypothetical protein